MPDEYASSEDRDALARICDGVAAHLTRATGEPHPSNVVTGAFFLGILTTLRHPEWAQAFAAKVPIAAPGHNFIDSMVEANPLTHTTG